MPWLDFREPVSAWSHAVGLVLALPAVLLLWRRSQGDRVKQLAFLVFGLTLAACYGGSTLYHAVRGSPHAVELCALVDYIGIYLLIAGTATPVALVILEGRWRWGLLLLAWSLAALGIGLRLTFTDIPLALTTATYLAMGWAVLSCYFELARVLSPVRMRPALLGGILYTFGAALNVLHWPVLIPGVLGPHEVFHFFVLGGSLAHFWFMYSVVAPYERRPIFPVARPRMLPPARALRQPLVP